MPLQHSGSKQAFKSNVRTLMGDIGKSPHVQNRNQALAIAYSIKRRNRAAGGRLYREAGGETMGDDEASFDPPLFLQSGLEDAPAMPERAPPMQGRAGTGGLAPVLARLYSAIRNNPGESALAAGSMAAPVAGGIIGSAMENASPDRPIQRGMMPLGGRRAPEQSAGVAFPGVGSIGDLFSSSAHASEAEDPRPVEPVVSPNEQEAAEIARINGLIAGKRQELAQATMMRVPTARDGTPIPQAMLKKESAIKAAQGAIAALQGDLDKVSGPDSPLGGRRASAMELYRDAVRRWEARQEDLTKRNVAAQLPYAVKHADRQDALQKWGPALSGATGALFGLTGGGKFWKPLLASAGVGAGEGAMLAAWPTLQDTEWLSSGKAQKEAGDKFYGGDPELWRRIGAGAMTHAGSAALSSMFTSEGTKLGRQIFDRARRPPPQPAAPPPVAPSPVAGVAPPPVTPPVPRVKAPPKEFQLSDGTVLKRYDQGKRGVRWYRDGKPIKSSEADTLRGRGPGGNMPSTAVHSPPTESQGGGIRSPMDIAYAVRRQNRAEGGSVHAGPILSSVPGRTDNHPMDVAEGSYVLPADHVSSLGEGNTAAGMEVVRHMFDGMGGEDAEQRQPVPINAAGGEFVIAPEVVAAIGGGDIKRGHEMLDQWVLANRRKHIRTLSKLPGPAKS